MEFLDKSKKIVINHKFNRFDHDYKKKEIALPKNIITINNILQKSNLNVFEIYEKLGFEIFAEGNYNLNSRQWGRHLFAKVLPNMLIERNVGNIKAGETNLRILLNNNDKDPDNEVFCYWTYRKGPYSVSRIVSSLLKPL